MLLQSSPNPLATKRIPRPIPDCRPPPSLSIDRKAWDSTIRKSYAPKAATFPQRYTSWAFASTRHFFGDWTMDGQGFTTYLNVTTGSVWVVVARPKVPAPLVTSFDPVGSNSTLWEFEGVLLQAGSQMIIQPETPYRFLTLDHLIIKGGGFYHMSTIMQSCIGAMKSFVYGTSLCDPGHFQASRTMLGRILMHLFQEIYEGKILDQVGEL
ncbi:hypothetical protein BYT27DRAFT_7110602 [Phlegmacium glaucopus]|nr:hypothetical protein BYT27DRAFT_7110602 [Phlegmacium glaucopus]